LCIAFSVFPLLVPSAMNPIKRPLPFLLFTLLALASLSCAAATRLLFGATPTLPPTTAPLPALTAAPSAFPSPTATPDTCPNGNCISACVEKLGAIVHPGGTANGKDTQRRKFSSGEEYTLVTYTILGDQIKDPLLGKAPKTLQPYQQDSLAQTEIWDYFAALIPPDQRTFLTHYVIYTDGKDNILASVAQSETDMYQWDLVVDIMDTSDPKDLTYTLVHEFGHLLTLNPNQVPPDKAVFDNPDSDSIYAKEVRACPTYFPGEGCSRANSYIDIFFGRFWSKIYKEWAVVDNIEDEDVYNEKLDQFYQKYQDQFVTDYAPTSPEEDIAESWSYFVLRPKPTAGTIADQKVLFFYGFPELIKLREQIARNLCNQLEK